MPLHLKYIQTGARISPILLQNFRISTLEEVQAWLEQHVEGMGLRLLKWGYKVRSTQAEVNSLETFRAMKAHFYRPPAYPTMFVYVQSE